MSLLLALVGLALAEEATVLEETDLIRWPDQPEFISATAEQGDTVEIVFRDAELVRIKRGTDFGWIKPELLEVIEPDESEDGEEAPPE